MGKRRFEYSDEKSNKFWEIEVKGRDHTVTYGKIGSNGQTKTKSFDNSEGSEKDAERLIKQKMKKGYEEVTSSEEPSSGELKALLGGLCQDAADEKILDALNKAVVEFGDSTIVFEDDWEVEYVEGGKFPKPDKQPESFHAISKVVSSLAWDGGGPEVGYQIGENGESYADEWLFDEVADEYPEVAEAGPVEASFLAGQNGLFFDPTSKLSNGEPALAFIDHECCEWVQVKSVRKLDYGQILLRMLSDAMLETEYIPELSF